jgi:hypothetical protein
MRKVQIFGLKHLFPFLGCAFFLAVDVKGMVTGDKTVQFTCRVDDFLHAGITEFNHGAVFNINQVIVLNAVIGFFELGDVLAELMLNDKIAVKKQFNRII